MAIFSLLFFLLLPYEAQAGFSEGFLQYLLAHDIPVGRFAFPNETHPIDLKEVVKSAPSGTYVSVGSERGFMGAALTPRVRHLALVDQDWGILFQNTINILLLKMARNREEYVRLRLKGTPSLWKTVAERSRHLTAAERRFICHGKVQPYWFQAVAHSRVSPWRDFHTDFGNDLRKPYAGANYLFDDEKFETLSELAKRGDISVIHADLNLAQDVERVIGQIPKSKLPLSVLDISNAWMPSYIKEESLVRLIEKFSPYSVNQSLLVLKQVGGYNGYPFQKIRELRPLGFVSALHIRDKKFATRHNSCLGTRLGR